MPSLLRRLALAFLVSCALVLANGPWCDLPGSKTAHHAVSIPAGDPAPDEPLRGEPSEDDAPHCSTTGSAGTAIRAQASDPIGPMAGDPTTPPWRPATTIPPIAVHASTVPFTTRTLIRLCQLRL